MIEEKNELTGQILSSDNNMSSLIEKKETLEGQLISSGNIIASLIAQKGAQGEKGDTGSQGIPGVSPIVTTSKSGKETTITIVDAEGTKTATINDGLDGSDGEDGYSPEASVTKSGSTATISITDKNGTTTASVNDGNDGNDGYSPSASVTKVGKIATITITDENGTTTAEIRDGEDGQGSGDMLKSTYDTDNNGIVDNAEKVNNHTVDKDVPSTAIFTDENAVWGNITGTISNQTDLNKALKKSQWSSVLYGGDTYCDAYIDGLGGNINDVGYSFMYDFTPCCYSSLNDSVAALTNVPTEYPLILEIFASQKDTMNWHSSDSSHIYKRVRRITDIEGNVYYQKVTFTNYDSSTQSYNETFSNWIKVLDNCNLAETDPVFTASDAYNISSSDIANWNNKSDFSGSYTDLTNKPTIPSKISDLTNDSNFIETSSTSGLVKNDGAIDTTSYSTFSGDYNDLNNKPTIPDSTSDLNNDSGFITDTVETMTCTKNIAIPKNGTDGYGLTNSDGTSIIRDWNNQNVTVNATGNTLFLGHQTTNDINMLNGKATVESTGAVKATNGIYSLVAGNVGTNSNKAGMLMIKRASSSDSPNNGVVLEYATNANYAGQLYIGDNATQGVYYNGWSNGTRGSWKKLAFTSDYIEKHIAIGYYTENKQINAEYVAPSFGAAKTVGTKLTLSSGKIKVGAGVSKVKISACAYLENVASTRVGYIWMFVYKNNNSTSVASAIMSGVPNYYQSIAITDIIVDVAQNDTLYLGFNNPNSSNSVTIRSGISQTRLYVEAIA